MKRWVVLLMGIGLLFLAGGSVPSAGGQSGGALFQGLGSLYQGANFYSMPWDVSADGTAVIGISGPMAFHWTEATGMVALPGLPYSPLESGADGVSGNGSMVGGVAYSANGREAIRWTLTGGIWVPEILGDLPGGGYDSIVYGMSVDGNVIVGISSSAKGGEACRWVFTENGWVAQGLGDLPGGTFGSEAYGCSADGSVVVGDSAIRNGWRAFRWTAVDGMKDLGVIGNRKWGAAYGCSGNGLVVVGESFSNHGRDEIAFRWTAGTGMVGLGDLPGGKTLSEAEAANYDGSIIVGWSATAIGMEAFIWDAAHGMRRVADVVTASGGFIPAGWVLKSATSVTSNGNVVTVVGKGIDPAGYTEAWRVVIYQ